MDVQREIDTRGLNCPLPILKAKKALAEMQSGELLRVVATDPGSMRDFQAFSRQTGNELVGQDTENSEFVHFRGRIAAADCECLVNSEVVSSAELLFTIADSPGG